MHVTCIDIDMDEILSGEGKQHIPESAIARLNTAEILKGFLNAFGVKNYKIVYHEFTC